MSGFVKALAQSVKVITTQMYNPFYWMKSRRETFKAIEERLPGAIDRMKAGEIIPEYEYVTEGKLGWEYRQLLAGNKDPWCMKAKKGHRANHTRPHVIYTLEDHRVIACVDCMDDMTHTNYVFVKVNEMGRCVHCGNCFVCLPHPEPDLFYQDHH